jgi:hypothetical protein
MGAVKTVTSAVKRPTFRMVKLIWFKRVMHGWGLGK